MEKNLNTKPTVGDFVDAVSFLQAYYDYRKKLKDGFSYGLWAQELGLKSRSFLRLVLVRQRNLTTDVTDLISKSLRLSAAESKYFTALSALSRAKTLNEKESYSAELSKLHKKFALRNHGILEISKQDIFEFLSSYKMPRLQVLLTLNDIEKSPQNFAKLLGTSEAEIIQHLEQLKILGFAEELEPNQWVARESQISTPDVLGNIALQSFHRKSLEEAARAIDLPKQTRKFQSMVIPLTEDQFEILHAKMRLFLEETLEKMESQDGLNKRIYQINLNIIPVSAPILRENTHVPVEDPVERKSL